MFTHTKFGLFLCAALMAATPASAQQLARSANLQVKLDTAPKAAVSAAAGKPGISISEVVPGGTAEALKILPGDYLMTLDGKPLPNMAALSDASKPLRAGDRISVTLLRGGRSMTVEGKALALPFESYDNAYVEYGAVPFQGGLLRDIYVAPSKDFTGPVVYFIQGFTCASVESRDPRHPHRELTAALVKRGIAVYRVEKPGVGDSVGVQCQDIGYHTELEAFAAAYRKLMTSRNIPADQIVIFGHSLGGIHAPQLASKVASPRGVVVYGTRVEGWADYMFDLIRLQPFWMSGGDPVELNAAAEEVRDNIRAFHLGNQSPKAFAAADPLNDKALRLVGWNGEETFLTRHHSLWQEISRLNSYAAWRDTKSHVLSYFGSADFAALNDEDQRLIAEMANFYRPGTGTFMVAKDSGHGFELGGSREEIIQRAWTKQPKPQSGRAPFNPEIGTAVADWIHAIMKEPVVATGG